MYIYIYTVHNEKVNYRSGMLDPCNKLLQYILMFDLGHIIYMRLIGTHTLITLHMCTYDTRGLHIIYDSYV